MQEISPIPQKKFDAAKRLLCKPKYRKASIKLFSLEIPIGQGKYPQRTSNYYAPHLAALKASIGSLKGKLILHIGAPPHALAKPLEDLSATSHFLDIDEDTVKMSKTELLKSGMTSHAVIGNAEKMPLQSAKYDAVVSDIFLSSGYLGEEVEEKIAKEVERVLKPGGKVILLYDQASHPFRKGFSTLIQQKIRHLFPNLTVLEKEAKS